jgi:hypothetical protein
MVGSTDLVLALPPLVQRASKGVFVKETPTCSNLAP